MNLQTHSCSHAHYDPDRRTSEPKQAYKPQHGEQTGPVT